MQNVDYAQSKSEETQTTAVANAEVVADKIPVINQTSRPILTTDLSGVFFDMPTIDQDGIFRPLLTGVSNPLMLNGMQQPDLKTAAMTYLALLSAPMGYPLSVQLVNDDPAVAVRLMDQCVKMAPADAVIEFQSLKPEELIIGSKGQFNGKCIVCPNHEGFRKVSNEIELLQTRGHASHNEVFRGKYGVTIEQHKLEHPFSFVGVATGKSPREFSHPAVIRLPVLGETITPLETSRYFAGSDSSASKFEAARLRKTFGRLKHREVVIPISFLNQIRVNMANQGCEHIESKLAFLAKTISICTIINNPPAVDEAEIGSALYGITPAECRSWLKQRGLSNSIIDDDSKPLEATKLDYYLAWLLLNDVIPTGPNLLTERQMLIFETIKQYNIGRIGSTMLTEDEGIKKLATISGNSGNWIKKEMLFERVNDKKSEIISLSTLNNELISLLEKEVIGRGIRPKEKGYAYYVQTFKVKGTVSLPSPSEIEDPKYKGAPMKIMNPLTGEIDEI